ncbi:putative CXXCH cytochrome family protein [Neobacillus bataviensis]|uniref:Putative CXXCH cytochrome family protein n=1 Tax=Neobacillus bataviensis TaxID=220685 RepID=A0A561D2E8_9BACI|nr:cytochrome c3 family protein [Neobacillus bataviensis]TWD97437.1 putative CXXCH cytochrome family protein [Neobacillus bataviensis]
MSKIKLSFSFLLSLLLVGMFSAVAFAAGSNPVVTPPGDPVDVKAGLVTDDKGKDNNYNTVDKSNANKTGSGVGGQTENFSNVIKSDDMVKNPDGTHGTQRTHGSYMNNTNSCASCHQTHTGASKNLLFKDGEYATCTACHDGTLGFYNVFTGSNSAGTFGGTHDGNMSVHLANGTVETKAAPGGNQNGTGNWEAEFTCASCHAPHGSYSDRLLHPDPNGMGNILVKDGGKRLENVPVVTDISAKVAAADVTYKDATGADVTINYVLYRSTIGTTVPAAYSAKGLITGDTVLQLMKWNGTAYVNDTDPWLHGYDFDAAHVKHYWTAFKDNTGKEVFDTDQLKKGEILGNGFAGVPASKATLVATVNSIVSGNVARGYVVKLDVSAPDANNVTTTTASSLWASKLANGSANPGYLANRGVAMSTFCSACHTDYLAGSGKETGTFDHAYRHTTTSDSYTCVRCHYAHGTDVTVMRDARGLTYDQIKADTTNYFPTVTDPTAREAVVKDYLLDKNPSSALKRYTNMAVCWGCHTSSHSEGTRNTDTYQYNPTPGVDTDRNGIEFDY